MGCRELQINDYFRMTDSVSGMDVPYYALADANKNITDYIDANGNVVAHYEYSPFGKIAQQSGTMASDFDYRFSSEVFDTETGLSYYNYRYYSAELGRWLSRDPIAERGGFNLYAMVGNDPVGGWDNLGLDRLSIVAIEGLRTDLSTWLADVFSFGELDVTGLDDALIQITEQVGEYDECGEDGNCIESLLLISHGPEDAMIIIGNDVISNNRLNIPNSPANNFISGIKALLCCGGASVEFRSCNSGDGDKGDALGQRLADKLDAKVRLYKGGVHPVTGTPTSTSTEWEFPGPKDYTPSNTHGLELLPLIMGWYP